MSLSNELDREKEKFAGFVLLREPKWSKTRFVADLKEEWGIDLSDGLGNEDALPNEDSIIYADYNGMRVITGLVDAPIPGREAEHFAMANYMWKDAVSETEKHTAHLILTVMGDGTPIEKAQLYTKAASVAATLSKLAFDACMFTSQNFGFIKLAPQYTTGSSIMPHKKNPDVFELTRSKCNKLQAVPQQITLITNNLPSGYYRDLQIIKEVFLPMFDELNDCLKMATNMMREVEINTEIMKDERYDPIFSVERVNELVLQGVPFRDAYKQVGQAIANGEFVPDKHIHHTHEGSIGNLCNDKIWEMTQSIVSEFHFERVMAAEKSLLSDIENLIE